MRSVCCAPALRPRPPRTQLTWLVRAEENEAMWVRRLVKPLSAVEAERVATMARARVIAADSKVATEAVSILMATHSAERPSALNCIATSNCIATPRNVERYTNHDPAAPIVTSSHSHARPSSQ